ncbi:MAG: YgfZ/GcvT domain-containing protein [Rhizobiaceae bacterium]
MYFEELKNRSLVRVAGEDAEHFLENLITCNVTGMEASDSRFGALLTPQGKILFDFFLSKSDNGYLLDINAEHSQDFIKRLMFYRLRAKVEIEALENSTVFACWDGPRPNSKTIIVDCRHPKMGYRQYFTSPDGQSGSSYASLRIENGIPEGGTDFEYGDSYPHETLMDQFGGVDFKKGCFVGQEVISRMHHRGTAKKRIVKIKSDNDLPATGATIMADEKPAGVVGSVAGSRGLGLLRLDRVAKSKELVADSKQITVELQDWVDFTWPEVN